MEVDNNLIEEFKELTRENIEFSKKCARIAQEINSGQLTIVQLVEELGPLLVDITPSNRELGAWILTQVLEGLSPSLLDAKQLNFISTFYADRLKDHHQVIPAVLVGILALSKFEQFPDGAATQLLSTLFQNVACQQQQERDRHNIYKILESLLNRCASEICTMGLNYVYGVISAVDGERNPKNLAFLFNWFPKFLKTVNLAHLSEEAFEVLACYFPVDFKAPAQDSNVITRDQLANSLAPCLTAIPQFAEFCFPLALEKLESSLEVAKLDALKLLEIGCSSFNSASYIQHSTEIWSQIQKEVFSNPSPVVEAACLETLEAVIKKISEDASLISTVKDISDTVKGNLFPDSKLFDPSAKLLVSVAKASKISSSIITKEILPILINTFNITTTPAHKIIVLKVLINFFDAYVHLHDHIEIEEIKAVPVLCLKASIDENNSLRKVGFDGLSQISISLPNEVRFSIYDNLQKLLPVPQNQEVRNSIIKCFDELAKNFPAEVGEQVTNMMTMINAQTLESYLDALCVIAPRDYFTDTIITILLDYLNKELNLGETAVAALKIILKENETDRIHSILIQNNAITTLIDWSLKYIDNISLKCLQDVACVLKSVIGNQSTSNQKEVVQKELPKLSDLTITKCVFLLGGIVCGLRRDVEINYHLLNHLTDIAMKENNDDIKNVSVQILANLLNKCSDDNILENYLNQFGESKTDLTIMSWITKALVMRNHARANNWTDKLIKFLQNDASVAVCFRIIINDNFDSLSTRSHCIRSFLYQQKFFTIVSNKLSENYRPEYKSYLVAFGCLLEHAPKQAILLQFKKLLKLIILCLDECEESDVLIVMLEIIKKFIIEKETCIEDNVSDFLTRFLKLSKFDKSLRVRILALQCLQNCASSFSVYKLLVYQQKVLISLGEVVDDKKRIVRREAVEARSLWFLLDAPM